jgi:FkbM family methyltransferase
MNFSLRCQHFLRKSWPEKISAVQFRFRSLWFRLFPSIALPAHLPYGGWWIDRNDTVSNMISQGEFEKAEWHFVNHFLRKGMTVVDIGAHHGFYTILCSKKVGSTGRVIAFEPSPGEQRKLSFHLRINHCNNVKIEPYALAGQSGKATLFVVKGRDTAFNSLRPPAVSKPIREITVRTMSLEDYLNKEDIRGIDFLKIDAEGAELEIFMGANTLFNRNSSPIIMAEVSDLRTKQWGYQASRIFDYLSERGYRWFVVSSGGKLQAFQGKEQVYNFVAVPDGKLAEMQHLIQAS